MKCKICEEEIIGYNKTLNSLNINKEKKVEICQECIDKFLKWQQIIFAKLFPTKIIKRRYEEK